MTCETVTVFDDYMFYCRRYWWFGGKNTYHLAYCTLESTIFDFINY